MGELGRRITLLLRVPFGGGLRRHAVHDPIPLSYRESSPEEELLVAARD